VLAASKQEVPAKPEPKLGFELLAESEPEIPAEPEPGVLAASKQEVPAKPEPKLGFELLAESEPETQTKPEPEVEPEVSAESEPEIRAEPAPGVGFELIAEPEPETQAEPEPEPEPEPEIQAETERKAESEAEPEIEPEVPPSLAPEPPRDAYVAPSKRPSRGLWSKLKSLLGVGESTLVVESTAAIETQSVEPQTRGAAPEDGISLVLSNEPRTDDRPTEFYTDIDPSALEPLVEELLSEEMLTDLVDTEVGAIPIELQLAILGDQLSASDAAIAEDSGLDEASRSLESSARESRRTAFVAHVQLQSIPEPAWGAVPPGLLSSLELRTYLAQSTDLNPLVNLGYRPFGSTKYLSLRELLRRTRRILPHSNPEEYSDRATRQYAVELGELLASQQKVLADPAQLSDHLRDLRELAIVPRGSKKARGLASEHFNVAQAHASLGDWVGALDAIHRAGFLDPGNPQIPPFEIACEVALGRMPLSDALVNLDSFISADDRSLARNNLVAGHLLYRDNQLSESNKRMMLVRKLDATFDVTRAKLSQAPGPETTALGEMLVTEFSPLE
jgi:hypothetical protein